MPQRSTKGHLPQGYPKCPQKSPRVQPKGRQSAPEFTQVDLSRPSKKPKVPSKLTPKFPTKLSGCPPTSSKLTYIKLLRSPIWPLVSNTFQVSTCTNLPLNKSKTYKEQQKSKTTLTRKSKFGNSKQSIKSTVKLFHQRFKNAQLLEGEIRRQISDNLDSEIVSQTFQEFIRNVEQTEKIVDAMAQSESSQVLEPLEEAEELTTMKIEIMQIVKQHEISMRKETSRASSRSSFRSRMSAVSSTSRKKSAKIH